MSKFDELKKLAEAATEIIGKTHPEIEAATAAFKQSVTPGAVAELLAIQAQLVEAQDVLMKSVAGMLDVMSNAKGADLSERLGSAYKELHSAYSTAHALAAAGAQS